MARFLFALSLLCVLAMSSLAADPLVELGDQLFHEETFGGNGRTCATCHDVDQSYGMTPEGIAAFFAADPLDPLFVAENDPALETLENPCRREGIAANHYYRRFSKTACSKKRAGLRFARGRGVRVSAATVQPVQSRIRYARPCTLSVSVMLPVAGRAGISESPARPRP